MPLYNIKKKMTKAKDRVGLAADEPVVAACMTFPHGHKVKTAIKMAAGGIATMGEGPDGGGYASQMPHGQHFIAMTDRRLIVTTVTSVSTNPGELVAEWPVDAIVGIDFEPGAMASSISIRFVDGSVVNLDGARSSGAEDFAGILD